MEELHRIQPAFQAFQVQQRLPQPSAQQARAHGSPGAVQRLQQRHVAAVPSPGGEQLQVPPGLRVQGHVRSRVVKQRRGQTRPFALPGVLQILQDRPGSPHRQRLGRRSVGFQPVGLQRQRLVVVQEGSPGRFEAESRVCQLVDGRGFSKPALAGHKVLKPFPVGHQDLRRLQSGQLQGQQVHRHLAQAELAGGDVNVGQPGRIVAETHRGQVVVGLVVQQRRLDDRARSHYADDPALDQPFGRRRVAQLLADRDLVPLLDELRQVGFQGHRRHPGQGHPGILPHRPRG